MIEFDDAVGEAKMTELVTVRAEGVRLDDLRTGLDVLLVQMENDF
jgi:hypothetical protein